MARLDRIRILIADEQASRRRMVLDLIAEDPRIEVVGVARNGPETLELASLHRPDIITMGTDLSGSDALAVTRELMRRCPTRIILITPCDEGAQGDLCLAAIDAGVLSVVVTPGDPLPGNLADAAGRLMATISALVEIEGIGRHSFDGVAAGPPSAPRHTGAPEPAPIDRPRRRRVWERATMGLHAATGSFLRSQGTGR